MYVLLLYILLVSFIRYELCDLAHPPWLGDDEKSEKFTDKSVDEHVLKRGRHVYGESEPESEAVLLEIEIFHR